MRSRLPEPQSRHQALIARYFIVSCLFFVMWLNAPQIADSRTNHVFVCKWRILWQTIRHWYRSTFWNNSSQPMARCVATMMKRRCQHFVLFTSPRYSANQQTDVSSISLQKALFGVFHSALSFITKVMRTSLSKASKLPTKHLMFFALKLNHKTKFEIIRKIMFRKHQILQ